MATPHNLEKQKRLADYFHAYIHDYGFEKDIVAHRQELILDLLRKYKPSIVVEIGCGIDPIYLKALKQRLKIKQWIIAEPIAAFAKAARKTNRKDIPLTVIHGFFEDSVEDILKVSQQPVDFVICSGLLHEVSRPGDLLSAIRRILKPKGALHINVPNAHSLHRRLAKSMNLIKNLKEFSARNKALMQFRVFDKTSLLAVIKKYGFTVLESGGYFLKPFSNKQMNRIRRILTPEVLRGLYRLGQEYPDLANEIYINATITASNFPGHKNSNSSSLSFR